MPKNEIPFDDLAAYLLGRAHDLLPRWLPGGHMEGKEYCCADISGGDGRTMKVNTDTGIWSDFAVASLSGGDLIGLYAAQQGIKQGEAALRLMEDTGYSTLHPSAGKSLVQFPTKKPTVATPTNSTKPPKDAPLPIFGNATDVTAYHDLDGSLICYIARYEPAGKRKVIIPFTWDGKGWVKKAFPAPRPLFNLQRLAANPKVPALIVEGEIKAKKLQQIVGDRYVVTTWMGGSQAEEKTDFKVLRGREVLLWPDADSAKTYADNHPTHGGQRLPYEEQPGPAVMKRLADKLAAICPEVKLLDLRDLYAVYGQEGGVKDGWDAADAAAEGWTWERFFTWATPRAVAIPAPALAARAEKFPVVEMTQNSGPAPVGVDGLWLRAGIIRLSSGQALCNVDNTLRLMKVAEEFGNDKEPAIWWDEFHQKIFTNWNRQGKDASEWSEVDTLNLLVRFQGDYGFRRLGDDILFKTVTTFAHRNPRSEPKEWMEKLVWDKKERIQEFWTTYFGVADGWYARCMGKNFWLSMVSRVYQPGCQSDHMVIMEGPEGVGKSSALGVIGGKWYTAMMLDLGKIQAFLEVLPGKMIVEISELDAFRRADANTIKKITSNREDRYRAAYGRMAVDFKRQCIFVGTTNEREYLAGTGSTDRRFWPVRVETVRMEELRRDREQLFAEAVKYYKDGRKWWEMPEEVETERDKRREVDPWEDVLQEGLHTMNEITTANIGSTLLAISLSKQDWQFSRRIGKLMHKLGYELVNRKDAASRQTVRRWVRVAQGDLLGE